MGKTLSIVLALSVVVLFALGLFVGAVRIPAANILAALTGGQMPDEVQRFIVMELRLPQVLTAALCGCALALCGLLLQTIFRNPLADPSVFGISSGAGLGVALVMLVSGGGAVASVFSLRGFLAILAAAFVGAIAVTSLIYMLSKKVRSSVLLIIAGLMIGYLASSLVTILNFFSTADKVKSYAIWGMGDFSSVPMSYVPAFATTVAIGVIVAVALAKPLNVFLLGEQYALNLGVDTRRLRGIVLLVSGLLTAVSTALCGPVAFIGLAVPHVTRMLARSEDYRLLVPLTAFAGCAVTLACNIICNLPGEKGIIPLNAVTPLIGAPVVVYVIMRHKDNV